MSKEELNFDPEQLHYSGIIGTGGIGSGKFFIINGDQTLGREESRSGHFLDIRDYCKQHIILHYIKVLLGPPFSVIPIGKLGDDDIGQILYNEMARTGFIMKRIEVVKNVSTLFSFCFSYPDGSGGNLTTDNSASARVDEDFISKATPDIQSLRTKGMIMAAPEVPIKARKKLVELGKQNGLFCAASFTSGEINEAYESGMFAISDLVAINMDEASAISGSSVNNKDDLPVVEEAIKKLRMSNEKIMVSVTGGKKGSWCSNSKELSWFPAVKTTAVSTAGAGDAFFAGILCGIALGLSMKDSQQLATLVAGMSVTSPHTIHDGINRHSLFEFLKKSDLDFSETIFKILEE